MRTLQERAMKLLAQNRVTVDLGGGRPFQKEMCRYRGLFEGRRFLSLDRVPGRGPDLVGDVHRLPFADGSLEGVICSSVLEHLPEPWQAVGEIHRVLRPGALAYIHVPFLFPAHPHADYEDYYRFTAAGLRHLVRGFRRIEIEARDDYAGALLRFATGFRLTSRHADAAVRLVKPVLDAVAFLLKGSTIGRGKQTSAFDALVCK